MSDYYDGIDREGERMQRLMDKVYEWWDSLSEEEQYNLMLDWYPNNFNYEECSADDFFGGMPSNMQLWIYKRENNLTEEDIQGQRDRAIDMQIEEKRLRGDDME